MANYGMILFVLGICVSVIGAAKLPSDGASWSDMVYLFNDGVILSLLGLALWRMALRMQKVKVSETGNDPLKLLEATQPIVSDLYRSADDLETYQFQEYVKILREQYLLPISNARHQLLNRGDMRKTAELLITLSYAERILNRVGSAASDQHLDEAARCAEEAYAAFQEVYILMRNID